MLQLVRPNYSLERSLRANIGKLLVSGCNDCIHCSHRDLVGCERQRCLHQRAIVRGAGTQRKPSGELSVGRQPYKLLKLLFREAVDHCVVVGDGHSRYAVAITDLCHNQRLDVATPNGFWDATGSWYVSKEALGMCRLVVEIVKPAVCVVESRPPLSHLDGKRIGMQVSDGSEEHTS